MKKLLILLCVLAWTAASQAHRPDVQADTYGYLTFLTSDGTATSLAVESLELTIADGKLVATNTATSETFTLTSLSKMYFSDDETGIAAIDTEATEEVEVYSVAGVALGKYETIDAARKALKSGVYVVKSKSATLKIAVK